tara:strand:- start:1446 stop:2441 length:996 start_codon:yes stop_codon:yes gene_type:complete
MNYVFAYIGEFGYELFNWNAAIRKWSKLYKKPEDKIIICSRKGLQSIYEFSDHYIDISNIESYSNSVGGAYTSICKECYENQNFVIKCCENGTYKIEKDIKENVKNQLPYKDYKWIFSSDANVLDSIKLGKVGSGYLGHGIYDCSHNKLDLNNNEFVNLSSTLSSKKQDSYILCQTAWRTHVQRSKVKIDYNTIFKHLEKLKMPIVLLDFDTGKADDSFSQFNNDKFTTISCDNFDEQVSLIKNAKVCIFFTEGDFRSHLYVPPFVGKDVIIISPEDILNMSSAPVDFWNENVFKFGGQMLPIVYEELISSQENLDTFDSWLKDYLKELEL